MERVCSSGCSCGAPRVSVAARGGEGDVRGGNEPMRIFGSGRGLRFVCGARCVWSSWQAPTDCVEEGLEAALEHLGEGLLGRVLVRAAEHRVLQDVGHARRVAHGRAERDAEHLMCERCAVDAAKTRSRGRVQAGARRDRDGRASARGGERARNRGRCWRPRVDAAPLNVRTWREPGSLAQAQRDTLFSSSAWAETTSAPDLLWR